MPFEPGKPKTGGRKKGTPNKVSANLRDDVITAYETLGGVEWLVQLGTEDKRTFSTLIGKMLPTEGTMRIEGDPFEEILKAVDGLTKTKG